MKKLLRLRERTLENDIKYSPPLSYRYLRMIGWFFLVIAQIAVVLKLNMKVNAATVASMTPAYNALNFFSNLPLPLFLVANFAYIFQRKDSLKHLLVFYGGMVLAMYVLGNIITFHYVHGLLKSIVPEFEMKYSSQLVAGILVRMGSSGYALNIFVDLFLCTLVFFFLTYKPKKLFQGKKIYIFRLFCLLPLLYEIGAIILKYFLIIDVATGSTFYFFLLPGKPPIMLVAFLLLCLLIKIGEHRQLKRFGDEHVEGHEKTNAHVLRVSILISEVFLLCVVLDILLTLLTTLLIHSAFFGDQITSETVLACYDLTALLGFGGGVVLILVIPFLLLFSYKKAHKNPGLDKFIPMVGIALIAFTYFEGIYQIITVNIPVVLNKLKNWIENIFGGGSDPEPNPLIHAIESIKNLFH